MLRKFVMVFIAALLMGLAPMVSVAQTNTGAGNQTSVSVKPKVDIIKKKITDFTTNEIIDIRADASELNIMAGDITAEIIRIRNLLNSLVQPAESDPYVASVVRKGSAGNPSSCEVVNCADNQKLHWTGDAWRCLNAVLPSCQPGQIFSNTTCSCVNPCTTPGEVPDTQGACCLPQQVQNGLCTTCPAGATWSLGACRCTVTGIVVQSNGICCPPNSSPNSNNSACICTVSGTEVPPNGTCNGVCPAGQSLDANNICCVTSTQVNGYCPASCPLGTTATNNGRCTCPNGTIIWPHETCPTCPAGTTPQGNQCVCPSGQVIDPDGECSVCPAGQVADPNDECCDPNVMEGGYCPTTSLICSATTIDGCDLPNQQISPNSSIPVNGVCGAGMVPSSGTACNATCQAGQSTAGYGSPSTGCVGQSITCTAPEVPTTCSGQPACRVRCPAGQSWNFACTTCVANACPGAQIPVTCNGQPSCRLPCPAGQSWNASCTSCEGGNTCMAPQVPVTCNGQPACRMPCPAGQSWNASCTSCEGGNTCAAPQVAVTCNGQPACRMPCPAGQNWNASCTSCQGGNTCTAPQVATTCNGQPDCRTPCSITGQNWNYSCTSCVCPPGQEVWNGQCVATCTGANMVRNGSGQCVCTPNYEMWNGQCVAVCGTNMVRNGSGQCVCAPGYEMWNGQCREECGTNMVRNGSGQCVCAPGYDMWNGQCMPECASNKERNPATGICECPANRPHWYHGACHSCPRATVGNGTNVTHTCNRCIVAAYCDVTLNTPTDTAMCECISYPRGPGGVCDGGQGESEGMANYRCISGAWVRQ